MTHHVKDFIESTIDLIEKKEYHEVFTIWYLHYYDGGGLGKDYQNLQELFKVFDTVGIDLYTESEEARKDIIAEHIYDYMDDILTNDPDAFEITLPEVTKSLNSKLDVRLTTINELFKEASTKLSAKHDIIRLPFRIQRRR